jgi:hypothetical protein
VLAWLERERPDEIGEPQWDALRRELAPISPAYLRTLLLTWSRESGVVLVPMVEGVRQDDFDGLEHSLITLLGEYERGDAARRTEVRRRVIEAKDHARWAARTPAKRGQKEEMAMWMRTWLENPPLFPEWVRLRRRSLNQTGGEHQSGL